jgi:regulator of chromosome condensation
VVNGLTTDESKSSVESKKTEKSVRSTKSAGTKEKKPPKAVVQKKPYFNPLPSPPDHIRPAPQLFVWGAGNFGQFGMGEDSLGEFEKPTRNKLVEEKGEDGAFGGEGAGLESVAAGGMYSLFIDEKGTVSCCLYGIRHSRD